MGATMSKLDGSWNVLPHGAIEELAPNLWRVLGDLEGMPLKRVMTIVKRDDGTLVVHNAIALDEAGMSQIDSWGRVACVIVPSAFHRLDAKAFARRYPEARFFAPALARSKVEEVVKVDGACEDFPGDDALSYVTLEGTQSQEGVLLVHSRSAQGTNESTLVFNDLVFNMPHVGGVKGFVLRHVTGSTGGPRVSRVSRLFLVKDKSALAAHLSRLADTPGLQRIIVSHHEAIEQDPAAVLRQIALTL